MSGPEDSKEVTLLPHHEQLALCTTRLPYRQGRKLTAVKVYSINNESKHLLVFGVPSLNLRQETKALFSRFGKLQFNITKYPSEQFTETYHAIFEDIQSARIAKKMLDTKNYYGGHLHICYAPELEAVEETREKLLKRQSNVIGRLKNLQNTIDEPVNNPIVIETDVNVNKNSEDTKLYMGSVNNIQIGKSKVIGPKPKKIKVKKSKNTNNDIKKVIKNMDSNKSDLKQDVIHSDPIKAKVQSSNIEVINFTSPETEILTNINESLNYNNFGKELIKPVPYKPVNKIKFSLNKKS